MTSPPATTGARAALATFLSSGVDACFANPGTSEMHFVAALDAVPGMRPVLGLSEGVVTGAADGYGRMLGRPAAALLHLGPGLANGIANLHNARRARTPVVAVVGDHATYHKRFDAPLESDIDALAGAVSVWVRRSVRPADVGADVAEAVAVACRPPGGVATLILPADVSWETGAAPAGPHPLAAVGPVAEEAVDAAAGALRSGERVAVLAGGAAVAEERGLRALASLAGAGATVLSETFPARLARGAGRPPLGRLAYLGEMAATQLAGHRHLALAGAARPVSFFAYPGRPSDLVPDGCAVHDLAGDPVAALEALAERAGASSPPPRPTPERPSLPTGRLDPSAVMAAIGALLPDDAVVVDEAATSSTGLGPALAGAPPHDLLTLTGGAIGFGLPAATGAAVACPERPVVCLEADGSSVYTVAALWTQARERLDVTTVLFDNGAYAILRMELDRVAAGAPGANASRLLDLTDPAIDFVAVAEGFGVPAERATTGEELSAALSRSFAEAGPHLVVASLRP